MDLIVAVDNNWAIGNKGNLLVSIPEDHKFFRQVTMGNVVVLGRKTLAGFPNGLPLAGRDNIILSTNSEYSVKGAVVVHSKEQLFETLKDYKDRQIFVIGGGTVYEMLLPYCRYAHVTKIDYAYEADTYFPNLDKLDNWKVVADSEEHTYFSLEFYYYKYENMAPLVLPF
ncbi:MAG: dihydrofolate reductase [Lachnospiraceae bacterium]|nr:dihydrofolate reductase [Lachnospiraceae bacterium]